MEVTINYNGQALDCLTPTQVRRIRARYLSGMTVQGIAAHESVSVSVVFESIQGGVRNCAASLKNTKSQSQNLTFPLDNIFRNTRLTNNC